MNDIKKLEKFAKIVDLSAFTCLICMVVFMFVDSENAKEAQHMATTLSLCFVSLGRIAQIKKAQNIISGLRKELAEAKSDKSKNENEVENIER